MAAILPFVVIAAAFAAVLGFFAWLAVHVRRRGTAGAAIGAAMAAYDEAFRTTAHASHHEIRAQAERQAPLPSPDDPPWRPVSSGPARETARASRPRRPRRSLRRRVSRLLPGR